MNHFIKLISNKVTEGIKKFPRNYLILNAKRQKDWHKINFKILIHILKDFQLRDSRKQLAAEWKTGQK